MRRRNFLAVIRLEFTFEPSVDEVYRYLQELMDDSNLEFDLESAELTDPMDKLTRHMFNEDLND